ncbi:MAG: GldG family protein [Myxococcota bacterium]
MKTLGKIFGGLGLVLVLSSPITLVFTSGSTTVTIVKATIGVVLIGAWFATHSKQLFGADAPAPKPGSATEGERPMGAGTRAGFFWVSTGLLALVTVGALAAANFIVARRNKTWDLTSKKIYSLAPQTTSTLRALKDPVKAIGFLPADHPAYDTLDELFRRYAAESERFVYALKDPLKNPDLAAKYQLREGQTTVVLTKGEGTQAAHTAINVLSEQELTNALIKLEKVGEQKVYYLVGHGEWPLEEVEPTAEGPSVTSAGELAKSLLQEGYSPQTLNLVEKNEIPRDAALLVIAGARSRFSDGEKALLEKYLEEGGRLVYFAEAKADPGLDALLAKYGVQVDEGLVADDRVNPTNPYVVVTAAMGDHDITRILKQVKANVELPTVRGLSVLHEGLADGVVVTPVVVSSPFAWVETTLDDQPRLSPGEKAGAIPLVLASTRPTASAKDKRFDEARVLVFGDSEVLVDAMWGHEADRNLVLNSLAWASSQVQKITIRPPDRDISTLDVDDAMLSRIRFISMDLLPISLVGFGLAIWLARRSK